MPQLISEDAFSQTYLTDDGQQLTVAKQVGGMPINTPTFAKQDPGQTQMVSPAPAPFEQPQVQQPQAQFASPAMQQEPQAQAMPQTQAPKPKKMPATPLQAAQDVADAYDQQAQAAQEVALVQATAADNEAAEIERRNAEIAKISAQKAEAQAAWDKEIDGKRKEYEQLFEKRRNTKVDNFRAYHNLDNGNKALAWIGIALSGLGSAMQGDGKNNAALSTLFKIMDDDVREQMANIDKMGQDVSMKRGELDDIQNLTKSRLGQYDLRIAERMDATAKHLEAMAARTKSETVKAGIQNTVAQLNIAKSEKLESALGNERAYGLQKAQLGLSAAGLQLQRDELAYRRQHDQAQLEAMAKKAEAEGNTVDAKLIREYGIPGTVGRDGAPVMAGKDTEAVDMREAKAALDEFAAINQEIQALYKTGGGQINPMSDRARRLGALVGTMRLKYMKAAKLGAPSEGEWGKLEEALGVGSGATKLGETAGLKASLDSAIIGFNARLKSLDTEAQRYVPPKISALSNLERPRTDIAREIRVGLRPGANDADAGALVERIGTAIDRGDFTDKELVKLGSAAVDAINKSSLDDATKKRRMAEVSQMLQQVKLKKDYDKDKDPEKMNDLQKLQMFGREMGY